MINPGRTNARGYNTGYVLESHSHLDPLMKKADFARAGFIEHALWVTRYDPDQRFAAGDSAEIDIAWADLIAAYSIVMHNKIRDTIMIQIVQQETIPSHRSLCFNP